MPNYRTNPNYGRNTGYTRAMDTPQYNRPTHIPTVLPEIHPTDDLSDLPLAMAYVPIQKWNKTFEISEGLQRGTIFPELYKPFLGGNCGYDAKNRY